MENFFPLFILQVEKKEKENSFSWFIQVPIYSPSLVYYLPRKGFRDEIFDKRQGKLVFFSSPKKGFEKRREDFRIRSEPPERFGFLRVFSIMKMNINKWLAEI